MSIQENRIIYQNVGKEGYTNDIESYLKVDGYKALKESVLKNPADICKEVEISGIKGRGGAGFPIGLKWKFLDRKSGKPIYLICNCDESEPGTFKDRQIIYEDPHQLIEGMMISAFALNAKCAFIYIRGEYINGYRILKEAINEAKEKGFVGNNICGSSYSCDLIVTRGAGAYVCGEETGLIASLQGDRAYPRIKPPYFPAVMGLYDCPTIVNNAESMCWIKHIATMGGQAVNEIGVKSDPGTHTWSVSGQVQNPGNFEIETGKYTVGDLLNGLCKGPLAGRKFKALIPGGSSTKVLRFGERFTGKLPDGTPFDWAVEDIPLDSASLMACGSALGSGGMIVLDNTVDMVEALANLNAFYAHESCGQCTPCREGTLWMSKITKRICNGQGKLEDIDTLKAVADSMCGKTVCALGDAAAWPTQSYIEKFKDEFIQKIENQSPQNPARLDKNSYKLI